MKRLWIASIFLVGGCAEPDWKGFVYPDGDDLTNHAEIGRFQTFEQCRAAALDVLEAFGSQDQGSFECGRQCEPSAALNGLEICAETRD